MFGNMFKRMDYNKRAARLESELKGEEDLNQKRCKKCSFCCWLKPCNLSKNDISIMANHFKTTPQELFKKYLVVDDAGAKPGHFTLTPIRKQWVDYAGTYLPADATYDIDTPCTFLNEDTKKCTLHGLAKPSGGKKTKCWLEKDSAIYSFKKEELMKAVGWDGDTNDYSYND